MATGWRTRRDAPVRAATAARASDAAAPARRRPASAAPASAARPSGAPRRAPPHPRRGPPRRSPRAGPRARRARPPATVLGPGVAERRTLMLVTFLLVVYGLVMAYSASAAQAYFEHGSSFYMFGRQVVWVCIGVGAMYAALARRLRLVPQGRRTARGARLRRPGPRARAGHRQRHQRRPPLDLPRRPGPAAQRVRQAGLRGARRDADRRAPARGADAQGVPAARRHRHRPGGGAHHARAGPRHHARPGHRRRRGARRGRRAAPVPLRTRAPSASSPSWRSSPSSRTGWSG